MLEITCSTRAIQAAGAFFSAFSTTFVATAVGQGHEGCVDVRRAEQVVAFSHTTDLADSACSALNLITARDIEEGERDVREGRWISLAELRRELRDQDR